MKKFKTKKQLTAEKKLYPLGTLRVEKKGELVVNEKLIGPIIGYPHGTLVVEDGGSLKANTKYEREL